MEMKKIAVIVAGGTGSRMGTEIPKQFLLIHGRPLLRYTLKTFLDAYDDLEIILVLPAAYLDTGREIAAGLTANHRIRCVAGGSTRFHSVQQGLELVDEESIIFIHDGVRCLLSRDLIHRCYLEAVRKGSAVPGVQSKDSVRRIDQDGSLPLDRSSIWLIQTPQTFHSGLILPAYRTVPGILYGRRIRGGGISP
jgi:2-C-methyl-D-erythritol 4-phosphate cytidylyltransferase